MTKRKRGQARGVTLIELILVMSCVAILCSLGGMYIREIFNLWNTVSFRSEVVEQGRMALTRMTREIRQVNNTSSVLNASASRFQFNDSSGNTTDYNFTNGNLTRNGNILVSLNNFTLQYYNNTSQLITSPAVYPKNTNITRVGITMGLKYGSQNKTLSDQVFPRSFPQ